MYTRLSNNSLWFVLQPLQLSSAGLVVVVAGSLIVYFLDLLTEQRYTSTKIHLSFLFWLLFTVSRRSYDITRVHSPATQRFFFFFFSLFPRLTRSSRPSFFFFYLSSVAAPWTSPTEYLLYLKLNYSDPTIEIKTQSGKLHFLVFDWFSLSWPFFLLFFFFYFYYMCIDLVFYSQLYV